MGTLKKLHETADCAKKDRNTPAKCALCESDHPANNKGCQVYYEILARKTKQSGPRMLMNRTIATKTHTKYDWILDSGTTETTEQLPAIACLHQSSQNCGKGFSSKR